VEEEDENDLVPEATLDTSEEGPGESELDLIKDSTPEVYEEGSDPSAE